MLVQAQVVPWWGTETGRAQSQRILMHWLDALLDSRSTRFSFTYRFAARAPCDSKGSEWAAKEKPTPISQFFFSTCCAWHPNSPPRPGGGSPPRPLRQKICYSDCTENCPLRPLRAPRRFGIRKSASNSGHSPLPGSGGCSMHCSMHCSMQGSDPWPPFTFYCPQAIVDEDAGV